MIMAAGGTTGFNGDRPLQKPNAGGMPGRRNGDPHGRSRRFSSGDGEKPTPEQLDQMSKAMVRGSQTEASRLMLGWFAMAHPAVNAQYTYAGEAESPDGKAYVIDVKNADNFTARLFIDEQTHLPLMVTYKAPQPRMMTQGGGPRQRHARRRQPACGDDDRINERGGSEEGAGRDRQADQGDAAAAAA